LYLHQIHIDDFESLGVRCIRRVDSDEVGNTIFVGYVQVGIYLLSKQFSRKTIAHRKADLQGG
jgi:hypothetical protein